MKKLLLSICMVMLFSYAANATFKIIITEPADGQFIPMFNSNPVLVKIHWRVENTEAMVWQVKVYCDDVPDADNPNPTTGNNVNTTNNSLEGDAYVTKGVGPSGVRNYRAWVTLDGWTDYYNGTKLTQQSDSHIFTIYSAVNAIFSNSAGGLKMGIGTLGDKTLPEGGQSFVIQKMNQVLTAYDNQISTVDNKNYHFLNWGGGNTNLTINTYTPYEGQSFSANYTPKPRAPQGVSLSSSVGANGPVRVSWSANVDAVSSYEISRLIQNPGASWQVVATTTITHWDDPDYLYAPGGGAWHGSYRVQAISAGNYSDYSNTASVNVEPANKIGTTNGLADNIKAVSESPTLYSMDQNYPNPFNPSTMISYAIPQDGKVSLKVYDMVGHEVADLVNGYKSAGRYNVQFDASKLSSGMYIYKIQAGSYSEVKKMQLLK